MPIDSLVRQRENRNIYFVKVVDSHKKVKSPLV